MWQKKTQHCKAIILQLKISLKQNKQSYHRIWFLVICSVTPLPRERQWVVLPPRLEAAHQGSQGRERTPYSLPQSWALHILQPEVGEVSCPSFLGPASPPREPLLKRALGVGPWKAPWAAPGDTEGPCQCCPEPPCWGFLGLLGWREVAHRNVSLRESAKWHHSAQAVSITSRCPLGSIW